MPSNPAKPSTEHFTTRTVLFVVFPGVKLLDLAGPLQVFADAVDENENAIYETAVVSINGGQIQTDTRMAIPTESFPNWYDRKIDTLVVAGGGGVIDASNNPSVIEGVSRLSKNSSRTASVCTGAFVLAACGLLNGRRAVTHWQYCAELSSQHPKVTVELNPIYVKDGAIWTSAGVTAGIDMALAMVSEDIGRAAALSLARQLVSFMVRPGGQSQFSVTLDNQAADGAGRFDDLHNWIANNIGKDLRVERLAEQVNMSPRNFSRLYTKQIGETPAKAVEGMRTEEARRLLETGTLSVSEIAIRCGFGDDERMRRSFVRILNVPPMDYRRRFGNQV